MKSRLFEGRVLHARKRPAKHQFWFRTFFFYLDLEELDHVFSLTRLVSKSRFSPARFRFEDHLTHLPAARSSREFREQVISILKTRGIEESLGPIRLLTQLSYFGFVMNPVNFYFCFDESGESLVAVVAEVNNTPWGEQHLYVLPQNSSIHTAPSTKNESKHRLTANNVTKEFHVSPFMSMNMTYQFDIRLNDESLAIAIRNFEDETPMLSVAMRLNPKPITGNALRLSLLRYPLYSFRVFAGIYWQALVLFLKKVPFYSHPSKPLAEPPQTSKTPHSPKVLVNK